MTLAKLPATLKVGLLKAVLKGFVMTVMEINCLKFMEVGKMRYTSKILKEGRLNYYGKDQIFIPIIMKGNTTLTSCLCN